ncbi:Protein of unknown function [Gryllus bimaculatus]|nr:Protein of unknown function [Gryllus bimaculatus]
MFGPRVSLITAHHCLSTARQLRSSVRPPRHAPAGARSTSLPAARLQQQPDGGKTPAGREADEQASLRGT